MVNTKTRPDPDRDNKNNKIKEINEGEKGAGKGGDEGETEGKCAVGRKRKMEGGRGFPIDGKIRVTTIKDFNSKIRELINK